MDNEPYRVLSHSDCIDLVADHARMAGHRVFTEFPLPSGHRADLLVWTLDGTIDIIEVKTRHYDSLAEAAYEKYWRWCHRLFIASPQLDTIPTETPLWPTRWPTNADRLGLIGVFPATIRWLRVPPSHAMSQTAQAQLLHCLP